MTDEKWDEKTWKTPKFACLNCGYVVDAASSHPLEPEPRAPQVNDVTVCLICSHVMLFTSNMLGGLMVRNPTVAELDEITGERDVQTLLQGMAIVRRHYEVSSRRAGKRRVVRTKDGPPDGEQLPQDRNRKR